MSEDRRFAPETLEGKKRGLYYTSVCLFAMEKWSLVFCLSVCLSVNCSSLVDLNLEVYTNSILNTSIIFAISRDRVWQESFPNKAFLTEVLLRHTSAVTEVLVVFVVLK